MSGRRRLALAAVGLSVSTSATAADRILSVTDFDRIQATGSMSVIVKRSNVTSVRISGDSHDLETIDVSVHGQTLRIGPSHFGAAALVRPRAPLTVYVTLPHLSLAGFTGSGRMDIDQVRGAKPSVWLSGPGTVNIASVDAETVSLAVAGAGRMTVAGKASQAKLESIGSATLDAAALTVQDAKITAYGSATIGVMATRSADATASGAASIAVTGHPACTIHSNGASNISCN